MSKTQIAKKEEGALAVASEVTEMFGGETGIQIPVDAPLPQVQILRETPQFELPDGETVKELTAHILYWHNANQYYDKPFGEGDGNGVPKCASSNGIDPDGGEVPEPGPCKVCEFNQFGSGLNADGTAGRSKACQNTIRLYLLVDGDVLPCVLKAPPSSLGRKESLMRWLTNAPNVAAKAGVGTKYQPIKVRFTLHRKDFDSGMSASVLDLETVRVLDPRNDDDMTTLTALSHLHGDFMANYFGRIQTDVAAEKQPEDDIPI
jgi:hypothetical protein